MQYNYVYESCEVNYLIHYLCIGILLIFDLYAITTLESDSSIYTSWLLDTTSLRTQKIITVPPLLTAKELSFMFSKRLYKRTLVIGIPR